MVMLRSISMAIMMVVPLLVLATGSVSAAPRQQNEVVNICDRTQEVQDVILGGLTGAPTCSTVTDTQLASITRLEITGYSSASIVPGDFAGLAGLEALRITGSPLLTTVPANAFSAVPTSLTTLQLDANSISSVDEDAFHGLSDLIYLLLQDNSISSLHENTFDGLSDLIHLLLHDNSLASPQVGLFDGLAALQTLDLSYNSLSSLPSGVFGGLTMLTTLNLNDNSIETLDADLFGGLTELRDLYLHRNSIETLDASIFSGLTELRTLDLYSNRISSLHEDTFDGLAALQTLDLSYNSLSSLPSGVFGGLTMLTTLNLNDNSIETLDADLFGGLTELRMLYLHRNSIETLDADLFGGLTELRELYLHRNSIETLDASIFSGLTELQTLDLSYNSLSSLPSGVFGGLTMLTTLNLNDNSLASPQVGLFGGLTALTTLTLHRNGLSSLPSGVFGGLTMLTTLNLNDNSLASLDASIFSGLTALHTLDLSYNSLSSLPSGVFGGLTMLTTLNLNDNSLASPQVGLFGGLTALRILYLNDNGMASPHEDLFDGLTALQTLYLNDNGLASPNVDLFDGLTTLRTLYLNSNGMASLNVDLFDTLGDLSTLELSDNSITSLTAGVFEDLDVSMQNLYLRSNGLTALPAGIFAGLTGLNGLDLSCNALTALDLTRFNPFALTLTYLDVSGNSFTTPHTEMALRGKLTNADNIYTGEKTVCVPPYDAGLSGLSIDPGALTPVFEIATLISSSFNAAMDSDASTTTITITPRDPNAQIEPHDPNVVPLYDDDPVADGWQVKLRSSRTTFQWSVLSANGGTTNVYSLVVFRDRPPAREARLHSVELSGVRLAETFDTDTQTYMATTTAERTTVTTTPLDPGATAVIKLNGTVDADGTVDLELGSNNVITVEVTAENGTKKTYTVTVTRVAQGKVLVSKKLLSLTEGNTGNYSVVLDRQPAANVTVTIGGHAGTNVTPDPTSLTFTTSNWRQANWVFVATTADTNTTNESVTLTHAATSSDSFFEDITIPSVIVNVDDQDAPDHHIRTIRVPQGLDALPPGEKALPEEEFEVWTGPAFGEIEGVAEGHIWRPSGIWGDLDTHIIWVVDPNHFGIHALKLPALRQGRVERHIAPDTSKFDQRFNYRCHFSEGRASGYGNPSLTVMWGVGAQLWIANESSGTLDAYNRDESITNQCYTRNVTSWAADGQSYTTEDENFKSPFKFVRAVALPLGPLTVWGIWASRTTMWISGPTAGVYTINLYTGRMAIAPGYEGHGTSYGLWSDGTTMWVATDSGWLRAYNLNSGIRSAEFDIRIQTYPMPPGDMWSGDQTIWVTNRMGEIDAYRLPDRPYAHSRPRTSRAIVADPLTASFASAPEAHDGENGFNVRIVFSDDVEITPEDMRDHALQVSGGTVTDAAKVKGRSDLWELTMEPAGSGPVSVLAPLGRACTDPGALCTADGRSLTAGPALQVPGPQADGPPGVPDQPEGTAVFIGGVDLEWNDVPGAASYDVQQYRDGQWTDLPADGAAIAFYGAGAIISGLDPESSLWFRVWAANAHGVSDWSEMLYTGSTSQFKLGRQARPDNEPASGAPVVHGTAQVGETLWADATGIEDGNGLDRVQFRYQWVSGDGSADTDIAGATDSGYTLVAADVGRVIKVKVAFTDRGGYSETRTSVATDAVEAAPQPDSPATGQPTISGTVQVGETLSVDTSGIADANGLVNATYSYQWVANDGGTDADISGETDASYTLVADDVGKTIKVKVTFTDDAGNEATLTSAATEAVEAAPQPPAKPTGLSAAVSHDTVTLAWDDPQDDAITGYVILRRDREIHPVGTFVTITDDTGSADTTYTDDTVEPDKQYVYRIKAINEHGEVSEISDWVRGFTPAVPAPVGSPAN